MSQRKKTPDILGDLLGNKATIAPPATVQSEPIAETKRQQNALTAKQQDVLTPNGQNGLESNPQITKPLSQQDVLPVKQQRVKAVKSVEEEIEASETETLETEAKTKMTFYLSEDSFEMLEDAQRTLRRMAKKAGKVQPKGITSKSALLEEALKLACADLEAKGEKSRFASLIA